MKTLLCTALLAQLLLLVFVTVEAAAPQCAPEELNKADECFRKLIVIGNQEGTGWPTTPEKVTEFCTNSKELLQCVRDYSKKCLSAFAKQVIGLLVRGVGKTEKMLCSMKPDYQLSFAKCANTGFSTAHDCIKRLTVDFGRAKNMPIDDKMHTICCSFYRAKKCIIDTMGSKSCTDSHKADYNTIVENIGRDIRDLSCSNVQDGSSACPPLLASIDKMENNKEFRSVLPPLIDVAKEF